MRSERVPVLGPLAAYADGLRLQLARLGYARGTSENHVRVMAHLSQWMASEGVEPGELTEDRVEQFLAALRAQWMRPPTGRTLAPMLSWLRDIHVVPPVATMTPPTPLDVLLERYHQWLVGDRGLAPRSIRRYEATARRFLEERRAAGCRSTGVEELSGAEVTAFLLRECSRLAVGSANAW